MSNKSTQFKPGQIANPYGRPPKGYSITGMMREMLKANPDLKAEIGAKLADKAKKGDITAIKMLWQYMDGMPDQKVELNDKKKLTKKELHARLKELGVDPNSIKRRRATPTPKD